MSRTRRHPLLGSLLLVGTTLVGCAGWRLTTAARLAKQSVPFEQSPAQPTRRLLVVGDVNRGHPPFATRIRESGE